MSDTKEIDLNSIYKDLILKKDLSFNDNILISYILEKKSLNLFVMNYKLDKKEYPSDVDIKNILKKMDELRIEVELLKKLLKQKSLMLMLNSLKEIIEMDANNFNNYEYALIEALNGSFFNLRMLLRKKTKRVFFKKDDSCHITSFKNIYNKKIFRDLYFSIKAQEEILQNLSNYKIWTVREKIREDEMEFKRIDFRAKNDLAIISLNKFIDKKMDFV